METAVTFATSDVGELNSLKDFIRSLDVSIIQEENIPQPIEMTPRLVAFLDKIDPELNDLSVDDILRDIDEKEEDEAVEEEDELEFWN